MSTNLYPYLNSSSFNETQEVWFRNSYYNQSGTNGVVISLLGQNIPNTGYHHSNFEISGKTGYVGFFVLSTGIVSSPVDIYINDTWNCMSWTYSGTMLSVYSNGVKKNTLNINRYLPPSLNYYSSLGTSDSTYMYSGGYYRGLIGSYKIYNRSLTDGEILQNYSYERQFFTVLISGNLITTMSTTGLTDLTSLDGQDDLTATIPGVNFDFYFFGTNYGNGLNGGIWWSSNCALGFGTPQNNATSWTATTGKGILIGQYDRRNTTFWYSTPQTVSGFSYIKCLYFGNNYYSDGVPNAVQFQFRFFRGSSVQYVEVSCKQSPSTAGQYNITNGSTYQNTYGSFTNMVANQSYVLSSDASGNNWKFYNNSYINL